MRRLKKKYEKPLKRWDKARIEYEKELMKKYGLRRKKEIWRAESIARKYRRIARQLIANPNKELEKQIMEKIRKYGFINATKLDDLLNLTVEHILERRLQTIVYKKGFANTIKQARQLIVHGHIAINGRKVTFPSYLVPVEEEDKITLLLDPQKLGLKNYPVSK
ncbi:MAG: 30S ribosomal protein S4 [Candidatus Aenigmatarchaeota archaeon]